MTCGDWFRDGDLAKHVCQRPQGHDGLHNDGRGVRWNGTWMGAEREEAS